MSDDEEAMDSSRTQGVRPRHRLLFGKASSLSVAESELEPLEISALKETSGERARWGRPGESFWESGHSRLSPTLRLAFRMLYFVGLGVCLGTLIVAALLCFYGADPWLELLNMSPSSKALSAVRLSTPSKNDSDGPRGSQVDLVSLRVKGLPALLLESQRSYLEFSEADSEHLHGRVGRDEDGHFLWNPTPLPHPQTEEELVESYTGYAFNSRKSESLDLDRPVPSFDSPFCEEQRREYSASRRTRLFESSSGEDQVSSGENGDAHLRTSPDKTPPVPRLSVVIVFHNENLSVLLRSLHSVLNRTLPDVLQEVILVDDLSDRDTHPWLGEELEKYVRRGVPKTKLLQLQQRRGLMGARAAGAAIASGEVIAFLDSHIEVLDFWAEPLLQRLEEDWRVAAMPRVASIDAETFEISNGGIDTLAFTWGLGHLHLDDVVKKRPLNANKKEGEPIESPIMPGGIFAINRQWWEALGGYDEGMRLYGGEEMELSFKVWMCGGRLEVLTCSKVAHVFRSDKYWKGQVYKVPGEEIARNKLRTAYAWMGKSYARLVELASNPLTQDFIGSDAETKSMMLKQQLGCKSFSWYIHRAFPELFVPDLRGALTGAVRNLTLNSCLDSLQKEEGEVQAYPCHNLHGTQAFLFDRHHGRLLVGDRSFSNCVFADLNSGSLSQQPCDSIEFWRTTEKLKRSRYYSPEKEEDFLEEDFGEFDDEEGGKNQFLSGANSHAEVRVQLSPPTNTPPGHSGTWLFDASTGQLKVIVKEELLSQLTLAAQRGETAFSVGDSAPKEHATSDASEGVASADGSSKKEELMLPGPEETDEEIVLCLTFEMVSNSFSPHSATVKKCISPPDASQQFVFQE